MSNAGNWTVLKIQQPDEFIYASDWNAEFQNVINNCNPDGVAGDATSITQMQKTKNPYEGNIPQLSSSLAEEIEEIRYQISNITGEEYWYLPTTKTIDQLQEEINIIEGEAVVGGNLHDHTGTGEAGGGAKIGTDAIVDGCITPEKLSFPIYSTNLIQMVAFTNSTQSIGLTSLIPRDNTIPQITEGQEVLSVTITPNYVDSIIVVDVYVEVSSKTQMIGFIYRSGDTQARKTTTAGRIRGGYSEDNGTPIMTNFFEISGTISPITYKFNAGRSETGDTWDLNPLFGGTQYSMIIVKEYKI